MLNNNMYSSIKGRITKIVNKNIFFKNVTLLFSGSFLGQILILATSPLLTRLYAPEDFGLLATYTSILGLFLVIMSLCYEKAIPIAINDNKAINLLALSFLILSLITLLFTVLILKIDITLLEKFNLHQLYNYLWLLPFSLFGAGVYQILNYWAIRKSEYKNIAKTKVTQSFTQVITQLAVGIINGGVIGLILGDVLGRANGSLRLSYSIWKKSFKLLREVSFKEMKRVAKRYYQFPLLSTGSVFFNSAAIQAPVLILVALYSTQVAGWFTLAQKIIGVPMSLIARSLGQVYYGEAANLILNEPKRLQTLFYKTSLRLLLISIIPLLILALVAPNLFGIIFGAEWVIAGNYVQYLTPMFIAQFVVLPLSQTLYLLERQKWQLWWDLLRFLVVSGGLIILNMKGYSPSISILFYGWAMFLSYIILYLLSILGMKKKTFEIGDNEY
ncbi:hypothetical protein BTS2_1919 [Bacillus sp. TS-2]|nr:hypothetical protein BTS2_1919 [Bacillus sp. TS-2]